MITNASKCSLKQCIEKTQTCFNYTGYIDKDYPEISVEKQDIGVGFGFVSYNNGLSQNVPIDIYTMLLTAEKIRRDALAQDAKVHILIGNHFAFESPHPSCQNSASVEKTWNKYIKKLNHILINLGIQDHYVFHNSSDIINDDNYKIIRHDLEEKIDSFSENASISKDTRDILTTANEKYNASNRKYFLDQTAIFKYLYDHHHCGVKVSWAKKSNKRGIEQSVSFDEPHFDRFYRDMYSDEHQKLSFIYTQPGFATNRTDERSKVIPYTAPPIPEIERILLSSKQDVSPDFVPTNSHLEKIVQTHSQIANDIDSTLDQRFTLPTCDNRFYRNICFLRQLSQNPTKHTVQSAATGISSCSSVHNTQSRKKGVF